MINNEYANLFCAKKKKNGEKQEEAAAGVFALNEDEKRKIKIIYMKIHKLQISRYSIGIEYNASSIA